MRTRSREQQGADRREGPQAERPRTGATGLRKLSAFRIAAIYALVAGAWILLSDRLLAALVPTGPTHVLLETVKGWGFVLVTAGLLHVAIRRSVESVRQLDAEVRATLDSIADAILVVDAEGRVANANRAALDLLGARAKSELMVSVPDLAARVRWRRADGSPFPPDGFPTLRALRGETLRGYEAVFRRPGGQDVFVTVSAAPVRVRPDGPVRLAVAVLRDVSEERRFDELRDEFLSTAAHEFKTPLAVIKAYAQLLRKRSDEEAPALQVINRQVDRLSRLVQQLLDVSRFRLGGPEMRRERFDLGEQLAQALERRRDRAEGHRLLLVERAPAPVYADRERIGQVLDNLIDNAVKFSPGGGDIEAALRTLERDAEISIRDAGVGIPREKQGRVFERYFRAHAGTADDYGGMGVGLDMSREIVARHGGRMWFESEPGVGSTFSFTLPLDAGGADARAG